MSRRRYTGAGIYPRILSAPLGTEADTYAYSRRGSLTEGRRTRLRKKRSERGPQLETRWASKPNFAPPPVTADLRPREIELTGPIEPRFAPLHSEGLTAANANSSTPINFFIGRARGSSFLVRVVYARSKYRSCRRRSSRRY